MDYHKDQFAFSDRMEYMKASLAVQACHQWLIRHCARRENGGTIAACAAWKDREWSIATSGQLRRRDVQAVVQAMLAAWAGSDLVVHGYDAIGQDECIRERKRAKDWRDKQRAKRNGTEQGAEQGTDTPPRTRMLRIRESDQTSPDQSRPVQGESERHARAPGQGSISSGGEGQEAEFLALLKELFLDRSPEAVEEWHLLADQAKVTTDEEVIAFVRYAVRFARKHGVKVEYARDVLSAPADWRNIGRARWLDHQAKGEQTAAAETGS